MGFDRVGTFATGMDTEGKRRDFTFRKAPTQTTGAGIWFDLSMSPGNPVPNYYIGAAGVFTRMAQSTDGGVYHGQAVSPATKHLHSLMALTPTAAATPLPMILLDYIGFYSFIDESVTDEQVLDNAVAPSRYADGDGVQVMAVVVAGQTGGQEFSIRYTNQDGVTDRVTPLHRTTTQSVNGTIITSSGAAVNSRAPFMALQEGDSGVRSIQGFTQGAPGDVGLLALVLVKPLADLVILGIDAPTEVEYWRDAAQLPRIVDDAYLNFICCPNGTLAGAALHGLATVTWG